jgi:integrase
MRSFYLAAVRESLVGSLGPGEGVAAPRTARAIDLAISERTGGPVFLAVDGRRLDRHGAGRIVRRVAGRAGIAKAVTPHTLRHAFITAAQGRGVASNALPPSGCTRPEATGPAMQPS